jgi:hypothetical protein
MTKPACTFAQKLSRMDATGDTTTVRRCTCQAAKAFTLDILPDVDCQACPQYKEPELSYRERRKLETTFPLCVSLAKMKTPPACCGDEPLVLGICHCDASPHKGQQVTPLICRRCPYRKES